MSSIVDFYSGAATDNRGRYLRDIQRWPDDRLENVHDFIQWMFPLSERSGVNPAAEVLDSVVISEFRASEELRANLRLSYTRMRAFYEAGQGDWLTPGNHNYLRITRILKCLRLLGLEIESREFFEWLATIYQDRRDVIGERTFRFWSATQAP